MATAVTMLSWGWRIWRGATPAVLAKSIRGPGLLFLLVCVYAGLQAVPGLPTELASPYWRLPAEMLRTEPYGSISLAPAATLTALVRLLTYGGIFWLAFQTLHKIRHADRTQRALALAAAAYSAYGLLMYLSGVDMVLWYPKTDHINSVTGTFLNRNHFATFTGLGLLCTLAALARTVSAAGWEELLVHPRPMVFVLLAALSVELAGLVLSQSRAGVISTLLACTVFLVGAAWRTRRRRVIWLGLPLAFLASAGLYLAIAGQGFFERLVLLLGPEGGDLRFPVYRLVLQAIADSPWTGVGAGAFEDAFKPYRAPPIDIYFDTAHSSWLQTAFELGLPAAVALWTAIGWLAIISGRALYARGPWVHGWLGACATLLVGLHATVDFSLQIPAVAVAYAAILGIGCSQSLDSRGAMSRPENGGRRERARSPAEPESMVKKW